MVKKIDENIVCPCCQGPLTPRVLACPACAVRVEGDFVRNEFSALGPELLHVLRIFVHCEGRIKDMEKALGLSYPTVKAQLAQLRAALRLEAPAAETPAAETPAADAPDPMSILAAMERGEVPYEQALQHLKATKRTKKT